MKQMVTLAAAVTLAISSTGARATTWEYTVSGAERVIGSMTVTGDATARKIDFGFSSNGRGPKFTTDIRLDPKLLPTSLTVSGVNTLQAPVSERLVATGSVLKWSSDVDSGSGKASSFYLPLESSPETYAMLVRALRAAVSNTLPLLPSGQATLTKVLERDVQSAEKSARVRLYLVGGVSFAPRPIWLDEHDELFAMSSEGRVMVIRRGWETTEQALRKDETRALDASDTTLARTLSEQPTAPVLFTHVRLFDAAAKTMRTGVNVLIDGNRITAVGQEGQFVVPDGTRRIDGAGGTLLPGLWDMHVHIQSNTDGLLDIANGVTSARDMGNDLAAVTDWRRRFATGELIGPRLMLAGLIDGVGPTSATGVHVSTPQELSRAITMFADNGYDEIKLYSSVPPKLVPQAILEAKSRGLRVGGHVPAGLRLDDVVKLGFTDVSHLNFLMLNFFPDDVQAHTNTLVRMTVPGEQGGSIDMHAASLAQVISDMRTRKVVYDVTICVLDELFLAKPGTPTNSLKPYADRLPPTILRESKTGGLAKTPEQQVAYARSFARAKELLKALHDGGVQLVPGTDETAGVTFPRELEIWGEAGIPPLDVLWSATLGAAQMMKRDADFGSIEIGKIADLVLVDGDPSKDLATIRRVRTVVKDGRFFDLPGINRALGMSGGQ